MIIAREREILGILIDRDPKAKEIYKKACYYGNDQDAGREAYEYNLDRCACDIDEGYGMKDPKILWEGLRELDQFEPYDNDK